MARARYSPQAFALDALVLAGVGAGLYWLARRAGGELVYRWNWSVIPQFLAYAGPDGTWRAGRLLSGLFATIRLGLWSAALALALGTAAGVMRASPRLLSRLVGGAYVHAVRNAPPIVLIFLFSYFLGAPLIAALGLDALLAHPPASLAGPIAVLFGPANQLAGFLTAIVTLGIIEGAYVAEIVRAGVEGVEAGQWDAARALGFSRAGTLAHVVLPQAFRHMLPALTGQYVSLVKDSAIVSVISIPELTFQAQELVSATYRSFEVWTLVLALYLALNLPCSIAARRLEKRLARADHDARPSAPARESPL